MYTVVYYKIYKAPNTPNEKGIYYGKTPILAQAQKVVSNAAKRGEILFIKSVCSDGKERYYI